MGNIPKQSPRAGFRLLIIIVVLLIVAAGLIVYGFFDPTCGWFPECLIKKTTGFDCPGCGSQRAIHALLHGRIKEAWEYNAMMICLVPAAIIAITIEANRNKWPKIYRIAASQWVAAAVVIIVIGWTILRNLH